MLSEIYKVPIPKSSQKSGTGGRANSKKEVATRFEKEVAESAETSPSNVLLHRKTRCSIS